MATRIFQSLFFRHPEYTTGVSLECLEGEARFLDPQTGATGTFCSVPKNALTPNSSYQEMRFDTLEGARTVLKRWLGVVRFVQIDQNVLHRGIMPTSFFATLCLLRDHQQPLLQTSALLSVHAEQKQPGGTISCATKRFSDLLPEETISLWLEGLAPFELLQAGQGGVPEIDV